MVSILRFGGEWQVEQIGKLYERAKVQHDAEFAKGYGKYDETILEVFRQERRKYYDTIFSRIENMVQTLEEMYGQEVVQEILFRLHEDTFVDWGIERYQDSRP